MTMKDDPAKVRAFDLFRTHGDVAEQCLRGAQQLGMRPASIVDLGAGAGPWGQRARLVFPGAHITALEIREEEAPHLARWYDDVQICDFRAARLRRPVDAVIGNWPFHSLTDAIRWSFQVVRMGGWILSLVPAGYGADGAAEQLLADTPPGDSLRLAGRLDFLGDGSADFQHHEALLWQRGATPSAWRTHPLPPLPASSRRWIVTPGTEREPRPLPPIFWPDLGPGGADA